MTDYQTNGYEDDDFRKILIEIEEFEDQKVSIRAEAAGKCGGIAKKIKNAKATAKALGIPLSVLGASIKARKLERQLQKLADDIPEDLIEVWEDAAGQFSMFRPADGENNDEPDAPIAKKAARKAKTKAQANAEAEQAEGAEVLDGLAAVH
jgi:hypothetical protein